MMDGMIYMDNAATTRLCDAAVSAMIPFMGKMYANPSATYQFGVECSKAINDARNDIAKLINADMDEIYFNSGGSEGDNQALKSFVRPEHVRMAVSSIEHHAILSTCKDIEECGGNVTYIPVNDKGIVNIKYIEDIIPTTNIISVMMANNEIGTIEPIEQIGNLKKDKSVLFHTDAVQAFGHIPIDVDAMNIDILTASAHKFGGPKGVGFMYVRKGKVFKSMITGGSQESGKRAGTENTSGIVGMAAAAKRAVKNMSTNSKYEKNLRNAMISRLMSEIKDTRINGDLNNRLPGNVNVSFKDVDGQALLMFLDDNDICVSTASACNSSDITVSHVLTAIGIGKEYLAGTIRLTLNHENTMAQVMHVCDIIYAGVSMLRKLKL